MAYISIETKFDVGDLAKHKLGGTVLIISIRVDQDNLTDRYISPTITYFVRSHSVGDLKLVHEVELEKIELENKEGE